MRRTQTFHPPAWGLAGGENWDLGDPYGVAIAADVGDATGVAIAAGAGVVAGIGVAVAVAIGVGVAVASGVAVGAGVVSTAAGVADGKGAVVSDSGDLEHEQIPTKQITAKSTFIIVSFLTRELRCLTVKKASAK